MTPYANLPSEEGTRAMLERLLKAMGVQDAPPMTHPSAPAERAQPSLARDAIIAMLNPNNGKLWDSTGARFVVPGALLVELAQEGRLDVSGTDMETRTTVRDHTPLGDPELDVALRRLHAVADGERVTTQVGILPGPSQVVERLLQHGELVEEREKKLGVLTVRRLRPTATARRDKVVATLRGVLLGESIPDGRTAQLLSVLSLGVPPKFFVPKQNVKDAHRRIEEMHDRIGDDARALLSAVRAARDKTSEGHSSNV